ARIPLRLHPHDFAMQCREPLTQSAAVIMLDMSYSMELFGRNRFTAAKKVALALAQLMSSLFPRDVLHIVGFGDTARHIPLRELPYVTVSREHTNTQDGLRLARTLLARQRAAHKHILLITDGRPTAVHLHGKLQLHTWGLHPVILEETYKEAKRCRDQAITLHTFMVADEAPLLQFVRRLTEVSQGRAFYTTPDRLGHYIIEDYLRRRSA
ncbi:MAG: VWA domain-containing protein, partial [Candidatus Tectomicrobia bacterium]|nr:VWA domain-containing protein [Candidatus Tectomicrobia bacterium]